MADGADTKTLGGAGFASQRFIFAPLPLHLPRHEFKGITLTLSPNKKKLVSGDPHTFHLVLKTTLRPPSDPKHPRNPPSPEPASISYEAPFTSDEEQVHLEWNQFVPTYRGREVPRTDPKYEPLDTDGIYELSLMCRSGFGKQEGEFEAIIASIEAWRGGKKVRAGCWSGMSRWVGGWWNGEQGSIRLKDNQ